MTAEQSLFIKESWKVRQRKEFQTCGIISPKSIIKIVLTKKAISPPPTCSIKIEIAELIATLHKTTVTNNLFP